MPTASRNRATPEISSVFKRVLISMKKILILSANPKNTTPLRVDEKMRKIKEGLKRDCCSGKKHAIPTVKLTPMKPCAHNVTWWKMFTQCPREPNKTISRQLEKTLRQKSIASFFLPTPHSCPPINE